jgi:hypothetical protein
MTKTTCFMATHTHTQMDQKRMQGGMTLVASTCRQHLALRLRRKGSRQERGLRDQGFDQSHSTKRSYSTQYYVAVVG